MKVYVIVAFALVVSCLPSSSPGMNNDDLIESVAAATGMSHEDATKAVDAVFEQITLGLARGESVVLSGFGTFSVRVRAARTARNPSTGETIQIAASKTPAFKAGKALKDAVNVAHEEDQASDVSKLPENT